MTKLTRRTMFQSVMGNAEDRVVAGIWVPANSMVLSARGYVDYHALVPVVTSTIRMIGGSMWWLPVSDPDTTGGMEAMWDTQVPKDTAAALMDLDSAAADTAPEWQPGEPKWEQLFDIGAETRQVWEGHALTHIGRNIGLVRDTETPFAVEFLPGGSMSVTLRRPFRTRGPGLLVLGFSSPDLNSLSSTVSIGQLAEDEWGRIQFIDHVVEQAMMALLGLVEAGAETPWQEATALLEDYLVPAILEVTASSFTLSAFTLVGEMTFQIDVEGHMKARAIDLG